MALRIFLAALVLLGLYGVYNLYNLFELRREIFDVPAAYTIGPQDADLTVVEFLDYSCSFCQQVHPTITEAVKQDGNVLYIPRPLPTTNADAVYSAIVVYAAGRQGKFEGVHNAIIANFQELNKDRMADIAVETGLDLERLEADISGGDAAQMIRKNGEVYLRLRGEATPTFMIGPKILYVPTGKMPEVEDFLRMFAQARGR